MKARTMAALALLALAPAFAWASDGMAKARGAMRAASLPLLFAAVPGDTTVAKFVAHGGSYHLVVEPAVVRILPLAADRPPIAIRFV